MDFAKKQANIIVDINEQITRYLRLFSGENIYEAMEYSLKAGGKRFRPFLMLAIADDFYKDAMPFAIAMEFIHTYSLIHDDLPCMDDDDIRRGKPTCHKKFDEATAVLAGDGLLNTAFEIMTDKALKNFEKKYIEAMDIIVKASGTKGMIDGQILDIKNESKKIDEKMLFKIYENKTGKLISASLKAGAVIAEFDCEKLRKMDEIGYNLGIAFQIQDDILDIIGDEKKIGKPINSDIKNEKSTYIRIYNLDKAKEFYKKLSLEALNALEEIMGTNSLIYFYIKSLIDREI